MLRRLLRRLPFSARRPPEEESLPPSDNNAADRYIAAGQRAEELGEFAKAAELYRKAVASAPAYVAAHLNLGIGLEASGDEEGAIEAYETALGIDPGHAFSNYNLGKLLYSRRELPRAERLLSSA